MKMFRKDEGFTLVELMVVVLIIGILVAIAIPVFNSAKANAQTKACYANERTMEGAYQTYLAASNEATIGAGTTIATLTNLIVPDFVQAVPECPAGGTYTIAPEGSGVKVSCDYTDHGHYTDD